MQRARVKLHADILDAGNRALPQEPDRRVPVVRWLIAQQQNKLAGSRQRKFRPGGPAQFARRAAEQLPERLVETANAAEACGERHFGHRQMRLVNELFGEQHAPCLRDRDRRGAEMLLEQAPQLALADAEASGQYVDIGLVQRAVLDQAQGARHRVRRAAPSAEIGRGFRPAAQAGTEARFLRGSRSRKKDDVLQQRRARRTDRAAIDSGCLDAAEEAAIKAGIALADGAVAGFVIELQRSRLRRLLDAMVLH